LGRARDGMRTNSRRPAPVVPSTFPPLDAGPHRIGRYGQGRRGTAGLPTGRLCTSRAMIGSRWGWDGIRGETVVRPVQSPGCILWSIELVPPNCCSTRRVLSRSSRFCRLGREYYVSVGRAVTVSAVGSRLRHEKWSAGSNPFVLRWGT
jgi:hypothetical protein